MTVRRLVRRVRRVVMLVSVATAVARAVKARRAAAAASDARPADATQWPPLAEVAPAPVPAAGFAGDSVVVEPAPVEGSPASAEPHDGSSVDAPWVAPVDGACPITHPVKGNGSSRIYHVPGSRFYERTKPERCYRDAAAAEADGMRAPKS